MLKAKEQFTFIGSTFPKGTIAKEAEGLTGGYTLMDSTGKEITITSRFFIFIQKHFVEAIDTKVQEEAVSKEKKRENLMGLNKNLRDPIAKEI